MRAVGSGITGVPSSVGTIPREGTAVWIAEIGAEQKQAERNKAAVAISSIFFVFILFPAECSKVLGSPGLMNYQITGVKKQE
jgi:hypothetical protein